MNKVDSLKLSHSVKTIRQTNNMTQSELARRLGIKQCSLSQIETGRTAPTLALLIQLCNIFNVSMDYFVGQFYTFDQNQSALRDSEKLSAIATIINNLHSTLPER